MTQDEVISIVRDARSKGTRPYLRDADLRGADLRGADLTAAYLRGADLRGANLYAADLYAADLTDANLRGANLTAANLTDANLRDANLRDADLTGADLRSATMPDGRKWEQYLLDPLAGICETPEARARAIKSRHGHNWSDCPMHAALGIGGLDEITDKEQRLRVAAFVAVHDSKILDEAWERLAKELEVQQ